MPHEAFLNALRQALENVREERFFKTERGYQGELLSALKSRLAQAEFPGDPVVEQEYQKTIPRHGLKIRPDLIVHVPFERGVNDTRTEGNFVAIEIKRDPNQVTKAFESLQLIAEKLHYPLTVLIMVDSAETHAAQCPVAIAAQTVGFAAVIENGTPVVRRQDCASPASAAPGDVG